MRMLTALRTRMVARAGGGRWPHRAWTRAPWRPGTGHLRRPPMHFGRRGQREKGDFTARDKSADEQQHQRRQGRQLVQPLSSHAISEGKGASSIGAGAVGGPILAVLWWGQGRAPPSISMRSATISVARRHRHPASFAQPAFDGMVALRQVLVCTREFPPQDHGMPFRALMAFALVVLVALGGGQRQLAHGLLPSNHRVSGSRPGGDEHHFVEAEDASTEGRGLRKGGKTSILHSPEADFSLQFRQHLADHRGQVRSASVTATHSPGPAASPSLASDTENQAVIFRWVRMWRMGPCGNPGFVGSPPS